MKRFLLTAVAIVATCAILWIVTERSIEHQTEMRKLDREIQRSRK